MTVTVTGLVLGGLLSIPVAISVTVTVAILVTPRLGRLLAAMPAAVVAPSGIIAAAAGTAAAA
jgi:hypothetical protein